MVYHLFNLYLKLYILTNKILILYFVLKMFKNLQKINLIVLNMILFLYLNLENVPIVVMVSLYILLEMRWFIISVGVFSIFQKIKHTLLNSTLILCYIKAVNLISASGYSTQTTKSGSTNKDTFICTCSKEYSTKTTDKYIHTTDKYIHLTNDAIQKTC